MSKKNDVMLLCEYCGAAISLDDNKCPSCGANCSKIIKNYKDEERKREEEEKNKIVESQRKITGDILKSFNTSFKITAIAAGVIFIVILFIFSSIFISFISHNDNGGVVEKAKNKITVRYMETAKNDNYNMTLDSYELYDHKSDNFPNVYNTRDGYQKIAFHFVVENKKDTSLLVGGFNNMTLSADDYPVEVASLEACVFCYAAVGSEKYESLLDNSVPAKGKLQGYVGYEVPVDKQNLVFTYDNITIKMENPAFQG